MPSGDTLAVFGPLESEPPASAFAMLDLRNEQPVLDFDQTLVESAVFSGVVPNHYTGGGLALIVAWAASSADSGAVVWIAAIERHAADDHDLDADDFAAPAQATDNTASATGRLRYTQIDLPAGQTDGLAAGEHFRVKLTRLADAAGDTLAGDAELVSLEVREA